MATKRKPQTATLAEAFAKQFGDAVFLAGIFAELGAYERGRLFGRPAVLRVLWRSRPSPQRVQAIREARIPR